MEFRQLEAFVAVSELKSFSKAAERLFLTQPTISSHVKALETELNTMLLIRTTKTIKLTEEGTLFLPYAKRILTLKETAIQKILPPKKKFLTIGASTIPSSYLLPILLKEYRNEYPNVFFTIDQGDSRTIIDKIFDGTVDIGLIGSKNDDPRLECRPFCEDSIVIATPASEYYMKLKQSNPDLRTLLKEPMIVRESGSGTLKASDRFFRENDIDPDELNIIARINDPESIKRMIKNNMGISILSGFSVQDLVDSGQLITYELDISAPRKFYIAYLKEKTISDQLLNFMKFIENSNIV